MDSVQAAGPWPRVAVGSEVVDRLEYIDEPDLETVLAALQDATCARFLSGQRRRGLAEAMVAIRCVPLERGAPFLGEVAAPGRAAPLCYARRYRPSVARLLSSMRSRPTCVPTCHE